jgi:hypothetical protein
MLNKVEIEVDDDLVQEVIRRYHVLDHAGPVHLALRSLLELTPPDNPGWLDAEYVSSARVQRSERVGSPAQRQRGVNGGLRRGLPP